MRRRDFVALVAPARRLAQPFAAFAAGAVRIVGVLMAYSEERCGRTELQFAAFRSALAKQGWDGRRQSSGSRASLGKQ